MAAVKQKILAILHLPPPVHGAALMGQYLVDSKLVQERFDVRAMNLALASNIADIGKWSVQKVLAFPKYLNRVRKEVKAFGPELVYLPPNAAGTAFYKDFFVAMLLNFLGCKLIYHFHNKGVSSRQNRFIDNLTYKLFFRNAKVILLSELLYADMQKYVKREAVFICPNGIPWLANAKENSENSIQNEPVNLLFLSNLIPSKGVLVLLEACAILEEQGVPFHCHFAGAETLEIGADIFEGRKNVTYHGSANSEKKAKLLQSAAIFVFPTFYPKEAFPLVLLEAMQFSLPVVATKEGGIPDIVKPKETGLLVERENAQDLARALRTLIENHALRQAMGSAGRKKFEAQFTQQRFEERMLQILSEAI
jgi:glycosyltransferase involved in cell wall biosynthesis